jgi:hypothetical protein
MIINRSPLRANAGIARRAASAIGGVRPSTATVGVICSVICGSFSVRWGVRRRRGLPREAGEALENARASAAERALAEAETRLRRLQAAIEAGADPAALIDPLNRAQERVMAARLERDQAPSSHSLGRAEVEAMLDYLGDVGAALKRATPEKLSCTPRSAWS